MSDLQGRFSFFKKWDRKEYLPNNINILTFF